MNPPEGFIVNGRVTVIADEALVGWGLVAIGGLGGLLVGIHGNWWCVLGLWLAIGALYFAGKLDQHNVALNAAQAATIRKNAA